MESLLRPVLRYFFFIVFLIAKAFDGLCVFLAPLPPAYANPKPSEHS